jgi:hypothetical protein
MDELQPMLDSLGKLKESWPGAKWEWDGRFSVVSSSFAATMQTEARASAVHALTRGWTAKDVETAPESLRAIVDRTGGLRGGQRLLAGTHDTLFGLWWPWGNGEMITLRIGLVGAEPTQKLRTLFDL